MYQWGRSWRHCLLVAAISLSPLAMAENEAISKAKSHVDNREYVAAQEALTKVERKDLAEADAAEFDRLMKLLPEAISGSKKAEQDSADALKAYDAAKWDDADKLYAAVVDNPHASTVLVQDAKEQRGRIVEKRQLSEAVKPEAPAAEISESTTTTTIETTDSSAQPTRITPVEEMVSRDQLLWQRAAAKFAEAQLKAEQAVAENHFDDARQFAASGLQVIEANRAYAPTSAAYDAARKQAIDFRQRISDEIDKADAGRTAAEQEEITRRLEERRAILERQRAEKIEQLFATGRQLYQERKYDDAAEAMRQILLLQPANAQAMHLLETYEDRASLATQGSIRGEYMRQMQGNLLECDEAIIPWHQDILYPKNWLEISRKRDLEFAGVRPDDSAERNMKLEELQPEIAFDDQPFDKAVEWLRDANKVNLAVDWDDLEANGVERTRPVSLKLRNVTFRTALKEMLNQVGGDVPLSYSASNEVLRVATRHKLDQNKFTQVYDIRDLITDIPKFSNSPRLDINAAGAKPMNRDIFGGDDYVSPNDPANESAMAERTLSGRTAANRDEASLTALLDLVRTTVAPDSWRETGGGDGALRELNGQLVVYNTSDAQSQVRDLLTQLRDTRALMIGVEARFLIVGSNFLNEIGVDLDFVFNQGTAGYDPAVTSTGQQVVNPFTGSPVLIPRQYSRRGFIPAPPGGVGTGLTQGGLSQPYGNAANVPAPGGIAPSFSDTTPIGMQQNSLNMVDPTLLSTGIPGAFGQQAGFQPAMNIVGSFLDNLQVDFLIRATQANRRSSIVQAPRLMMFNGQRAWVAVVRSRQYVSSVTATVAEQVAAVAPQVANVQSGTVLDVEGTISNDKKYVTLTVRTGLAQEPIITQFEVQRGSGNSPSIFTSLTDQELRAIRTTVSIPDGGTVLIGGLKQTGEIEVEAGVPILSKIPVLKRAFTNTTSVRDTQTLLILLKAKILIQKEAEDEAFPSFAER